MHRIPVAFVLTLLFTFASSPSMAIEIPDYRVIEQDGAYELREYSPYLIAETEVEAGFMNAGNIAFGRLFRYISGANTSQTEIAMTAPVEQSREGGGQKIAMTAPVEQANVDGVYRVGFVVPKKFTRETVPKPLDPRVSIREVPARTVAVWRYSGRWTEENFREHERDLRALLVRKSLRTKAGDSAIIARYDAPFIPWFMRRNEVLIPLAAPNARQ
ncbi:MAG: heme-binding protein [Gammaproteobacteria bacterium]|nr:heme-binding protein [Gammaproteobacteria bacterium]